MAPKKPKPAYRVLDVVRTEFSDALTGELVACEFSPGEVAPRSEAEVRALDHLVLLGLAEGPDPAQEEPEP